MEKAAKLPKTNKRRTNMLPYTIYWLVGVKHCEQAVPVKQTDGKIAWVCKHDK
jgi:hypothetical protein